MANQEESKEDSLADSIAGAVMLKGMCLTPTFHAMHRKGGLALLLLAHEVDVRLTENFNSLTTFQRSNPN